MLREFLGAEVRVGLGAYSLVPPTLGGQVFLNLLADLFKGCQWEFGAGENRRWLRGRFDGDTSGVREMVDGFQLEDCVC